MTFGIAAGQRPLFRWRRLTPDQARAIKKAYRGGVAASELAVAYGVHTRTIHRAIRRADNETHEVRIGHLRAIFEIEDETPVQVTPWVPA